MTSTQRGVDGPAVLCVAAQRCGGTARRTSNAVRSATSRTTRSSALWAIRPYERPGARREEVDVLPELGVAQRRVDVEHLGKNVLCDDDGHLAAHLLDAALHEPRARPTLGQA